MPVTTRSQSQRSYGHLSTLKNAKPRLPSKLSTKIVEVSSHTTTQTNPIKSLVVVKKRYKAKRAVSLQKTQKRPRKHQSSDRSEQSHIATGISSTGISSTGISDSILTHWSCQTCSCSEGAFDYPIDSCIHCGHEMEEHGKVISNWDPNCTYICERTKLVVSILQMLEFNRVVVIRATPQAGKSILLKLLGNYILRERRDLEPVYVQWESRTQRNNLPYEEFLNNAQSLSRVKNAAYRTCNLKAKVLYLIDEAQISYEEIDFWDTGLKNRLSRQQPSYVLVCLYGLDVSHHRLSNEVSRSLSVSPHQRVELRPSSTNNPFLLFSLEETKIVVQKWAMINKYKLTDDLYEYLHLVTGGHPGMVGFVLLHFETCVLRSTEAARREAARNSILWTPRRCYDILIDHSDLIDELTKWGRGFWTTSAESMAREFLNKSHPLTSRFPNIHFFDVVNALRLVATQPRGYTPENKSEVLEFCHRMGYLHTEETQIGGKLVTYTFASPIHRRVAYRRLCPGLEPSSTSQNLSLRQTCLNAIERLSPSALRARSTHAHACGNIPEAAYQEELYCALTYELRNLPILPEYSHNKRGRIDFFVFDKKWGIEVLQGGSISSIAEHAARFATGGKYQVWNIFNDYIILNFCSKETVRKLEIEDVEVQSRVLQVALDPNEYTAEVYTCDKQLLASLTLGEGRLRLEPDYDPLTEDPSFLQRVQNQMTQLEQEKRRAEQEQRRAEQEQRRAEQEKEQIGRQAEQDKGQWEQEKRQLEQEMEELRRQTNHLER